MRRHRQPSDMGLIDQGCEDVSWYLRRSAKIIVHSHLDEVRSHVGIAIHLGADCRLRIANHHAARNIDSGALKGLIELTIAQGKTLLLIAAEAVHRGDPITCVEA